MKNNAIQKTFEGSELQINSFGMRSAKSNIIMSMQPLGSKDEMNRQLGLQGSTSGFKNMS